MKCFRIGYKYAERATRLSVVGMTAKDDAFEHPELAALITRVLANQGLTEADIISIARAPTADDNRSLEFMVFCRDAK